MSGKVASRAKIKQVPYFFVHYHDLRGLPGLCYHCRSCYCWSWNCCYFYFILFLGPRSHSLITSPRNQNFAVTLIRSPLPSSHHRYSHHNAAVAVAVTTTSNLSNSQCRVSQPAPQGSMRNNHVIIDNSPEISTRELISPCTKCRDELSPHSPYTVEK